MYRRLSITSIQRKAAAVALLLVLPGTLIQAALLPESPPRGVRVTVSLGCDFEDHYWEVSLYIDTRIPMNVAWHAPGMFGDARGNGQVRLDRRERREIYAAVRRAANAFELRLTSPPPLTAEDTPRGPGERTLAITALVLDEARGRVDRFAIDYDLVRDRAYPPGVEALLAELKPYHRRIGPSLSCR